MQRFVNAAFSPAVTSARLTSEILRFLDTRPSIYALEEWRPVEQAAGGGLPSSAGGVAVAGGGSCPPLPVPCLLDVQVPLLLAVLASPLLLEDESLPLVEKMMRLGVSPHATDSARRSAVWWAVYMGRLRAADLLVAHGGAVRMQVRGPGSYSSRGAQGCRRHARTPADVSCCAGRSAQHAVERRWWRRR